MSRGVPAESPPVSGPQHQCSPVPQAPSRNPESSQPRARRAVVTLWAEVCLVSACFINYSTPTQGF